MQPDGPIKNYKLGRTRPNTFKKTKQCKRSLLTSFSVGYYAAFEFELALG